MNDGSRRGRQAEWIRVLGALVVVGLTAAPAGAGAQGANGPLQARVWLGQGEGAVLQRGDRARLYYRSSEDAYVAVFHMNTDGIVRLLHPRRPDEDHYTRGRRDYRLHFPRSPHWYVDDDPGVGYFFVVASPRPLDLSAFHYSRPGGGWDLTAVGRRVYRDPYAAMDDYVAHLIPGWQRAVYALDFVEYHVGRRYRYPRFLCYDCHGFRPYRSWNPYHRACRSFRLVIYTDPYFYPVYRYRGSRVVYTRPAAPNLARFVFKERAEGEPRSPVYRRRADAALPGVRGTDRRRSPEGVDGVGARPGGTPRDRPTAEIRRRDPRGEVSAGPGRDTRGPTGARRSDGAPRAPEAAGARRPGGEAPSRPTLRRRSMDDDEARSLPSSVEGNSATRAEPSAGSREPRRPSPPEAGNRSRSSPPSARRRPPSSGGSSSIGGRRPDPPPSPRPSAGRGGSGRGGGGGEPGVRRRPPPDA